MVMVMAKARKKTTSKLVDAPKGYHWMKSGRSYKLMKDDKGPYKAHKGASKKAPFKVAKHIK